MTGIELAPRFRQLGEVRLVALTGHGRPEDRARCMEAGFHHFLLKPASPEEYLAVLSADSVATIAALPESVHTELPVSPA